MNKSLACDVENIAKKPPESTLDAAENRMHTRGIGWEIRFDREMLPVGFRRADIR